MHRLRTVTSLDVSAEAGHHAMPAALLLELCLCLTDLILTEGYSVSFKVNGYTFRGSTSATFVLSPFSMGINS